MREGEVENGDAIEFNEKQESGVTITEIVNLYSMDAQNQELLRRATEMAGAAAKLERLFSETSLGCGCLINKREN